MKQHDDVYLNNLQHSYNKIDDLKFKIGMKLRYHPEFNTRLRVCSQILDSNNERCQMRIQNEG